MDDDTGIDLAATKKRALEALVELTPRIESLDPEQKFRICIDTVKFTDEKRLLNAALEAALAIEDLETRANALIEVVTEINFLKDQQPAA